MDFDEVEYNWRVVLGLDNKYEFWYDTDFGDYIRLMKQHYQFLEKQNRSGR